VRDIIHIVNVDDRILLDHLIVVPFSCLIDVDVYLLPTVREVVQVVIRIGIINSVNLMELRSRPNMPVLVYNLLDPLNLLLSVNIWFFFHLYALLKGFQLLEWDRLFPILAFTLLSS